MVGEVCMVGGHAWLGGMHDRGVCMVGGMCGKGGMCGRGPRINGSKVGGGGHEGRVPPGGPNSFMYFFRENLAKLYIGAPPAELAPPPLANPGSATTPSWKSWIRHWIRLLSH